MTDVVFLHSPSETSDLPSDPHVRLVAVTPAATHALEKAGRDFLPIDRYLPFDGLCVTGEAFASAFPRWLVHIDGILAKHLPPFGTSGFSPAHWEAWVLRLQIAPLLTAVLMLRPVLEQERPARVIVGKATATRFPDIFWTHPYLAAGVLPGLARTYGAEVIGKIDLDPPDASPVFRSRLRILRDHARFHWKTFPLWWRLRHVASSEIIFMNRDGESETLLAALREEVPREACRARRWPTPTLPPPLGPLRGGERAWDALRRDPATWEILGADRDALRPLLEPRLERWVRDRLPRLAHGCKVAERVLDRIRPRAVVGSAQNTDPIVSPAEHAAKMQGIPVVLTPHNTLMTYMRHLAFDSYIERYDDILAYGPIERRALTTRTHLRARIHDVGSSRLDLHRRRPPSERLALRRRILGNDPRPAVLYVAMLHIGCQHMLEGGGYPDTYLYGVQSRAVRLFRKYPGVRLLYRPFPLKMLPDPLPEIVRTEIPGARVVDDVPCTDLLWAADAVIIDIPSTALFEAIATPKPVCLLIERRWLRLTDAGREALRRRVRLFEDSDAFLQGIDRFLAEGDFRDLENPDDDFLKGYGVSADDGKSWIRAREILLGQG